MKIPILAFLGLLTVLPAQAAANPKPFLAQATRLFPIQGIDSDRWVEDPWISGHELLQVQADGALSLFDIVTRRSTPLPALSNRIDTWDAYNNVLRAAPAGRWVMWGDDPVYTCTVDDARHFEWPEKSDLSTPFWCSDGRHWISLEFAGKPIAYVSAHVHTLDNAQETRFIPSLPAGLKKLEILTTVSEDCVIARTPDPLLYHRIRHVGPGAFIIQSIRQARRTQRVSIWSLHKQQPLHQWTIRLPMTVSKVFASPTGDRLAWILCPTIAEFRRHGGRGRIGVWISDIDGNNPRELGYVDTQVDAGRFTISNQDWRRAAPRPLVLGGLDWSPDGKHLSFEYDNALWDIPTN